MKKIVWSVMGILLASYVFADVVLIDATTRNGGFEDGTDETFNGTDNWQNGLTEDNTYICRTSTNESAAAAMSGEWGAKLHKSADEGAKSPAQGTGYIVQTGDVFKVECDIRAGYGFDLGVDKIRINLFVTTNVTTVFKWAANVDVSVTEAGWNHYSFTFSPQADPDVIGKELFVRMYLVGQNGELAFLDNFMLSVEAEVPPIPLSAVFTGIEPQADDKVRLAIDVAGDLERYTLFCCSSIENGAWEAVSHSDDGVSPFIATNLNYSTGSGSNRVVYVTASNSVAFFKVEGQ